MHAYASKCLPCYKEGTHHDQPWEMPRMFDGTKFMAEANFELLCLAQPANDLSP
jgi:hypothetical protein